MPRSSATMSSLPLVALAAVFAVFGFLEVVYPSFLWDIGYYRDASAAKPATAAATTGAAAAAAAGARATGTGASVSTMPLPGPNDIHPHWRMTITITGIYYMWIAASLMGEIVMPLFASSAATLVAFCWTTGKWFELTAAHGMLLPVVFVGYLLQTKSPYLRYAMPALVMAGIAFAFLEIAKPLALWQFNMYPAEGYAGGDFAKFAHPAWIATITHRGAMRLMANLVMAAHTHPLIKGTKQNAKQAGRGFFDVRFNTGTGLVVGGALSLSQCEMPVTACPFGVFCGATSSPQIVLSAMVLVVGLWTVMEGYEIVLAESPAMASPRSVSRASAERAAVEEDDKTPPPKRSATKKKKNAQK